MNSSIQILLIIFFVGLSSVSCQQVSKTTQNTSVLTSEFKKYWYQGTAEISTYTLSQNRYGELRKGTASLIYVTEPFLEKEQVKSDYLNEANIPVLKLNSIKKFTTGVYPYSIMQSCFLPLKTNIKHALKVSASIQEWCGHTYLQVNNRTNFEIIGHSYFANEGDIKKKISKSYLENEIWNLIRVKGGENLPQGELKMIPSLEFIQLKHAEIKAYKVNVELVVKEKLATYSIYYPELHRKLSILFQTQFPYIIEGWEENIGSSLPTIAKRVVTKQLPYWNQNSNQFNYLRKDLELE